MLKKDDYLPDTLKYSMWITNPDALQPEPNQESKTGLSEKNTNQEEHIKRTE